MAHQAPFLGIQERIMTAEGNSARVQEIHSQSRTSESSELKHWLGELVARKGSDLLLVPEAPASIRFEGVVTPIGDRPLSGEEIEAAVFPALATHAREEYQQYGIADSSYRVEGLGRFRINLHRERGRAAATVRALPSRVPALERTSIARGVEALAALQRGLVIIGGATGSGKTTTLAALVNEINRRDARHIVTIEDPIEYEHTHNRSVIEQVEIGVDAPDFPTALRAALRQAPDVIVVGEMRDPETVRIALSAAETGHLVFYDLAHDRCGFDRSRIADSFPQERQHTVRAGDGDGVGGDADADADAAAKRRACAGGGTADGGIRGAAAHPQECAAASASGDHDHAQAGIVHAGGISGAAGVSAGTAARRCDDAGAACGGSGYAAEGQGVLRIGRCGESTPQRLKPGLNCGFIRSALSAARPLQSFEATSTFCLRLRIAQDCRDPSTAAGLCALPRKNQSSLRRTDSLGFDRHLFFLLTDTLKVSNQAKVDL